MDNFYIFIGSLTYIYPMVTCYLRLPKSEDVTENSLLFNEIVDNESDTEQRRLPNPVLNIIDYLDRTGQSDVDIPSKPYSSEDNMLDSPKIMNDNTLKSLYINSYTKMPVDKIPLFFLQPKYSDSQSLQDLVTILQDGVELNSETDTGDATCNTNKGCTGSSKRSVYEKLESRPYDLTTNNPFQNYVVQKSLGFHKYPELYGYNNNENIALVKKYYDDKALKNQENRLSKNIPPQYFTPRRQKYLDEIEKKYHTMYNDNNVQPSNPTFEDIMAFLSPQQRSVNSNKPGSRISTANKKSLKRSMYLSHPNFMQNGFKERMLNDLASIKTRYEIQKRSASENKHDLNEALLL